MKDWGKKSKSKLWNQHNLNSVYIKQHCVEKQLNINYILTILQTLAKNITEITVRGNTAHFVTLALAPIAHASEIIPLNALYNIEIGPCQAIFQRFFSNHLLYINPLTWAYFIVWFWLFAGINTSELIKSNCIINLTNRPASMYFCYWKQRKRAYFHGVYIYKLWK